MMTTGGLAKRLRIAISTLRSKSPVSLQALIIVIVVISSSSSSSSGSSSSSSISFCMFYVYD